VTSEGYWDVPPKSRNIGAGVHCQPTARYLYFCYNKEQWTHRCLGGNCKHVHGTINKQTVSTDIKSRTVEGDVCYPSLLTGIKGESVEKPSAIPHFNVTSGGITCSKGTPIIKKVQPLPFYQRRKNERRKKTEFLTLNKYMGQWGSMPRVTVLAGCRQ
jgi:hypothetical protein